MKAQILIKSAPVESNPLELAEVPVPETRPGEILVKVSACGVCHTELDEVEEYSLEQVNDVLLRLKSGGIRGAGVLKIGAGGQ